MIRKAELRDVNTIHSLLKLYSIKGELLARPLSKLYDHLRDFWVYEDPEQKKVVGCCALQLCWEDLAEIRSMAVDPDFTSHGIGTMLLERAMHEAVYFKIKDLAGITQNSFTKNYVIARLRKQFVCILNVRYDYTSHALPSEGGRLRELKPDTNWLTVSEEHILPKPSILKHPPIPYKMVYL